MGQGDGTGARGSASWPHTHSTWGKGTELEQGKELKARQRELGAHQQHVGQRDGTGARNGTEDEADSTTTLQILRGLPLLAIAPYLVADRFGGPINTD